MKKELIITKDGSHSLFVPDLNENYHSIHGSITEGLHVFIKNGIHSHSKNNINILEIGFGTGLNTLLTLENIHEKKVHYTTLEPFPISQDIYSKLNFHDLINSGEIPTVHRWPYDYSKPGAEKDFIPQTEPLKEGEEEH